MSGDSPGGSERVEGHSGRFGTVLGTNQEVQDGSGNPGRGPERVGGLPVSCGTGWGGPGRVGKHSGRSGTGRGTLR